MRNLLIVFGLLWIGAGCTSPTTVFESRSDLPGPASPPTAVEKTYVVLPIEYYVPIYKRFGEYFEDRFRGYHVAEDLEVGLDLDKVDLGLNVPVVAIANGAVRFVDWVSGYGGVMVVRHPVDGEDVNAIYGHLDVDRVTVKPGDAVTKGQVLAVLGDHKTEETDGERKHLHFALYKGDELRLNGYESSATAVDDWINPHDFFLDRGEYYWKTIDDVPIPSTEFIYSSGEFEHLRFSLPVNWDIEYVPSLKALNLFKVSGTGTARGRSQVFIRYFDASDFQTLSTVTIHKTEDLMVGAGPYKARRYEIEKKSGVPDFKDQPSWRNTRHMVTDFRAKDGFTRYFVVAANPDLDPAVYEQALASMRIVE